MTTYQYGYQGARKTKEQLLAWWQFSMVDPEMQRRLLALMDAGQAAGHDPGIGGGGRTTEGQLSLFLSRHHKVSSGGCCSYKGQRYQLNAGQAHAAPPGKSYHEPTTPLGNCLAVDLVGWQDHWAKNNCKRFGLDDASDASTQEEWHDQPSEIPSSRFFYNPATMHPLDPYPLPGYPPIPPPTPTPPVGADMPIPVNKRVYDTRYEAQRAGGTPFAAGEAREVPVSYGGEVIAAWFTVIPYVAGGEVLSQSGYIKAWSPDSTEPDTSCANWHDGKVTNGMAIVDMRASKIMVRASAACHVAIDNQVVW